MPRCAMIFADKPSKGTSTDKDEELQEYQDLLKEKCHISALAAQGDPRENPNYRNNPSLLISYTPEGEEKSTKNVIIDVGKTFRETAIRWFPSKKVHFLDAVILTHEHADAVFGLDDIRGVQKFVLKQEDPPKKHRPQIPMPIFLSQDCLSKVAPQFKWLFPNHQPQTQAPPKNMNETKKVSRHVASLDVNVFESFKPFDAAGLKVIPLPIMHGEDLVSYGFAFSVGKTHIVYLSDISRMLPETMEFIQKELPPTDILVVDALRPKGSHPVHFSMAQAIDLANQLSPTRGTYLVGMSCDSFLPHKEQNEELAKKYGEGKIQLARDGLEIDCF